LHFDLLRLLLVPGFNFESEANSSSSRFVPSREKNSMNSIIKGKGMKGKGRGMHYPKAKGTAAETEEVTDIRYLPFPAVPFPSSS
jgi:hypothetical protein